MCKVFAFLNLPSSIDIGSRFTHGILIRRSALPPAAFAVFGVLLGIIAFAMLILIFNYGQIWFQAYWSKAAVTFLELFGMSLRKVNARTIIQARIMATQAGLGKQLSPRVLEAHYLAGGDVPRVIRALIAAHRDGIDLD